MKNIKLFFIIIIVCGWHLSSSSQTKKLADNYVCLNPMAAQNLMKNYSIKIPDNWCSYYGFHDRLSHSPKTGMTIMELSTRNCLRVYSNNTDLYISKDIEEALSKHLVYISDDSEYNDVYTSDNHETYGKYYLIKNKTIQNGKNYLNLKALFNYKNQNYVITYSVLEENFDSYLNDVVQIISTFKIKKASSLD